LYAFSPLICICLLNAPPKTNYWGSQNGTFLDPFSYCPQHNYLCYLNKLQSF
jgi:hypothetical protein